MPPQIQAILQNRRLLIIIGASLLVVIILIVVLASMGGGKKGDAEVSRPLTLEQRGLATLDNAGRAIEIQALLARENLRVDRIEAEGGKTSIKLPEGATEADRDRAVITMVQSGLMDGNVGLEIFDKGDMMASREEKRIKLIRAQQGQIARLVRKINPIEDATVNLSIPDPTMFKSEQKPVSASVQVTLPLGERLNRDKVRAIINLVVGSIQGIDPKHVALSDTNGNTYNSVLDSGAELNDKIEEQDGYMKQKVAAQLDKLVGPGNYVVTVSTLLREATKETMVESYDPAQSALVNKQQFSEKLSPNGGNPSESGGAMSTSLPLSQLQTSSVLPPSTGPGSVPSPTTGLAQGIKLDSSGLTSPPANGRGYTRDGVETAYANGRTQSVETQVPGMIEDISIAVTIDQEHFPSITYEDLQRLLANAASPKVNPEHVTIAEASFKKPLALSTGMEGGLSAAGNKPSENGWIPWAIGSLAVLALLLFFVSSSSKSKNTVDKEKLAQTQRELDELRNLSNKQNIQFHEAQQQTQQILEAQQRQLAETNQAILSSSTGVSMLKETLSQLKTVAANQETLDLEEDELPIKSWIESS